MSEGTISRVLRKTAACRHSSRYFLNLERHEVRWTPPASLGATSATRGLLRLVFSHFVTLQTLKRRQYAPARARGGACAKDILSSKTKRRGKRKRKRKKEKNKRKKEKERKKEKKTFFQRGQRVRAAQHGTGLREARAPCIKREETVKKKEKHRTHWTKATQKLWETHGKRRELTFWCGEKTPRQHSRSRSLAEPERGALFSADPDKAEVSSTRSSKSCA